MTSTERRREGRYQRRKAKRDIKKARFKQEHDNYETLCSYDALWNANLISRKNVCWKASVQRYQRYFLKYIYKSNKTLMARNNPSRGFVEFDLMERGKKRHIRSVHYTERVIQRALCDHVLVPILSKDLIYDNSACMKGKGVHWAIERTVAHLKRFYRENNFSNEGYIVSFDFKGYFDSIVHNICFNMYHKRIYDKDIIQLLHCFIDPFGYPLCIEKWRRKRRKSDEINSGLSLGLGSQVSQITAVAYPNSLDHYIKEVLCVRHYCRYMDDGFLFAKTKEEANEIIDKIIQFCQDNLQLTINRKKTCIQKLNIPFKFLKVRFHLLSTGKVVKKMSRDSITRQRGKMKKLNKKLQNGAIDIAGIQQSYGSWKGYALYRHGERAVYTLDKLYERLYHVKPPDAKIKRR